MGSGIKGLQRVGSGIIASGSGITNGGIGISSVLRGSGMRLSKVIIKVTKYWKCAFYRALLSFNC